MITFLAPAVQVCLGFRRVGEEPGGLDYDVGTDLTPRQGSGITLGVGPDDLVAHLDAALDHLNGHVEPAQNRVILQQVSLRVVVE